MYFLSCVLLLFTLLCTVQVVLVIIALVPLNTTVSNYVHVETEYTVIHV